MTGAPARCRRPPPNLQVNDQCFQLFGFDVMLDADCRPWLLEVMLTEGPFDADRIMRAHSRTRV